MGTLFTSRSCLTNSGTLPISKTNASGHGPRGVGFFICFARYATCHIYVPIQPLRSERYFGKRSIQEKFIVNCHNSSYAMDFLKIFIFPLW
jgi:hypothetical protein